MYVGTVISLLNASLSWAAGIGGKEPITWQDERTQTCTDSGVDTKDKIPFPFCVAEQRFELADGEKYLLPGWFRLDSRYQLIFQVDLKSAPHLASKKRLESPYYRVILNKTSTRVFEQVGQSKVSVPMVARYRVRSPSSQGGAPQVEVVLEVFGKIEPRVWLE
jgi:hypothetical protein